MRTYVCCYEVNPLAVASFAVTDPMPPGMVEGDFHQRFQIAAGGSHHQLLRVEHQDAHLHISRGTDSLRRVNRHQLAAVRHAHYPIPSPLRHGLVRGAERSGFEWRSYVRVVLDGLRA